MVDEKKMASKILEGIEHSAPAAPAMAKKEYALDGKDRILLPLSWGLGLLLVELMLTGLFRLPGLLVPVLVAAWYAVAFWYRGAVGLNTRANVLLLAAVCLLALTFALYSDPWLRAWNLLALPALMMVQLWQWVGAGEKSWTLPTMLWERFSLTMDGLFCKLGAPFQALVSLKREGHRRMIYILLGLLAAALLLFLVVPMLLSADALFEQITGGLVDFLTRHLSAWVGRLLAGLCAAPFLFGLLYALRRPEKKERKAGKEYTFTVDAAAPVTVLLVMDALYCFFIAVQFTALFGGAPYLERIGISYADYARSGFFQLVAVSVLNLILVMACLQLTRREGRGWVAVRVLSTALVAASVVMLCSAAWRMTLYVRVYGLSLKRFLTYWGMAMLAIFFTAALLKIWRAECSFFKVFFAASVAGWLVLNFINPDWLVARYNVSLYQSGEAAVIDLPYLAYLSYDTLSILEELPGEYRDRDGRTLAGLIDERRWAARWDASDWRTWSVSAQLAALGG